MAEQNERVVKVGSCWRLLDGEAWMIEALDRPEGDTTGMAQMARWEASSARREQQRPVAMLLDPNLSWRECDPEDMVVPSVEHRVSSTAVVAPRPEAEVASMPVTLGKDWLSAHAAPPTPMPDASVQLTGNELRARAATLRRVADELDAMARNCELDRT